MWVFLLLGILILFFTRGFYHKYLIIGKNFLNLLREHIEHYAQLLGGLWKLYQSGNITTNIISEFLTFRIRSYLSEKLESGHLSKGGNRIGDLVYYDVDRKFRVRFPKQRGVRQIINVTCENGEDITPYIFEVLGPGNNFHGIPTTPKILGYDFLSVRYRNGDEIDFRDDEIILLKP